MKTYTERADELKQEFSLNTEKELSESPLEVKLLSFHSSVGVEEKVNSTMHLSPFSSTSDNTIKENIHFVYPIFKFKKENKSKEVIILLHGLNERSWDKYLPWAERLAMDTGKAVLLFPISFHINRAPQEWSNPRAMMPFVNERKERLGKFQSITFLNIALSNRLTDSPFRFYSSGKQTVINLMSLTQQIKDGNIPFIEKNASVDIFAYSIGGLVSQLLLMSNPEDLFSDTKLFMFCSGSVFLEMHGDSRSIMDEKTFATLKHYYEKMFLETNSSAISNNINQRINRAFKSMISLKDHEAREPFFTKAKNRIKILSLKKDIVIPTASIIKSLGNEFIKNSHTEMDFSFKYTHENPFPTTNSSIKELVNQSFDAVFTRAAAFLA